MTVASGGVQRGGGRSIHPSSCIRNIATLADMSFNPPSGLYYANIRQVRRESSARVRAGSSSIRRQIRVTEIATTVAIAHELMVLPIF